MSYPQQPGNWPEQSWPAPNQPYSDPGYVDPGYGDPGYGGYAGHQAAAVPASPGYGYGYGPPVPVRQTNGLAIGAMVVSLASPLLCGYPAIVGAIMGHVARRQIRERGEDGDGMALTGVIVGWIVFALAILVTLAYVIFFILLVDAANNYEPYPYPS
jgi:hypothetical protein